MGIGIVNGHWGGRWGSNPSGHSSLWLLSRYKRNAAGLGSKLVPDRRLLDHPFPGSLTTPRSIGGNSVAPRRCAGITTGDVAAVQPRLCDLL
jgi:hypothetical protein